MIAELPNLMIAKPEMIMAVGALALLMVGVFNTKDAYGRVAMLSAALMAVTAFVIISDTPAERTLAFGGMFVTDGFAVFTKVLVLISSVIAIFMSKEFLKDADIQRFEYPILITLATLGMMIMISANNLMTLYVGLELQSLSLYVLAAMNRTNTRSTEAGLKYFVLGALSSGMLLYGVSLIYGFTGSTDFDAIALTIKNAESMNIGLIIGLVFLMSGLAFKVSAVPFHMWTPDVYEGAPTPVTAFFAAAPKVAALALFVRTMYGAFPDAIDQWQQIVIFISIASMLIGAFVALVQTNIKRLMAYSSIGHAGFALIGLAAGTGEGVEALLIYVAIYATMTLGAFGVILTMRRGEAMVEGIDELAGLSKNNLPLAIALATFMFSLAGIPMLAGFFGKWFVIVSAVNAGLLELAIIAVLSSVVSAYYYLRIIKIMFFDDAKEAFDAPQSSALSAVIGVAALVNSPVSFLLIAPLAAAAAWAASSLLI